MNESVIIGPDKTVICVADLMKRVTEVGKESATKKEGKKEEREGEGKRRER